MKRLIAATSASLVILGLCLLGSCGGGKEEEATVVGIGKGVAPPVANVDDDLVLTDSDVMAPQQEAAPIDTIHATE